jgi:N utilization substance protein B
LWIVKSGLRNITYRNPKSEITMLSRRKAREQALELLYQVDIGDIPISNVIQVYQDQLENAKPMNPFVHQLLQQTVQHITEIDTLIKETVEHWSFDRIAVLDRNILRLAISELLYLEDIPARVTINEAVELAKRFSTKDSGKFVNGILDKIIQIKNIVKD